ncbi:hypothetical protein ABPG74_007134 [Tetrahymena malaccensis]
MKIQIVLISLCILATFANSQDFFVKLTGKQFASSDVFPIVSKEPDLKYDQLVYGQQAYNITHKGPPHGYTFYSGQTRNQLTFYVAPDQLVARDQTDIFLARTRNVGKFVMSKFQDTIGEDIYIIIVNVTATLDSRIQRVSVYNNPDNVQFYYFFLENKQILTGQIIKQSRQQYVIQKLESVSNDFVDLIQDTLFYKTYFLAKTNINGNVKEVKSSYPLNKSVKKVCLSKQNVLTFITDQDELYQGNNIITNLPQQPVVDIQPGKNSTFALLYKDKAVVISSYQTADKSLTFQQTTINIQPKEYGIYSRISLANIKGEYSENYKVILNTNSQFIDESSVDFFVSNNSQII